MPQTTNGYAFIPRGGSAPLEIERAEGAWLYRSNGERILDAAGGAIVANIGHGRSEVADAMAEAAAHEAYVVPVFATASRLRLMDRLRKDWLPEKLGHIFLTSGGS